MENEKILEYSEGQLKNLQKCRDICLGFLVNTSYFSKDPIILESYYFWMLFINKHTEAQVKYTIARMNELWE